MADNCIFTGQTTNVRVEATYSIPTGSCCTSICTCNVTTEASCGGTWYSGESCPGSCPSCPPTAVCCDGISCSLTYEVNCNGTWLSGESSCGGSPCSGACCDGVGGCTTTTEGGCGDTYKGDGTSCATEDICAVRGSCCLPDFGGCQLLLETECTTASGEYGGDNTTCTPSPCPFGHGGPIVVG